MRLTTRLIEGRNESCCRHERSPGWLPALGGREARPARNGLRQRGLPPAASGSISAITTRVHGNWRSKVSGGTRGKKPCICRSSTRRSGCRFSFTASSKGGIAAIANLAGVYGRRIRDNPHDLPIVALGVGSYRHRNKAYGKILVPEFDIVGGSTARQCRVSRRRAARIRTANGRSSAPAADTLFWSRHARRALQRPPG